jgi:DNA-binding transcriptional ArsR family regulator
VVISVNLEHTRSNDVRAGLSPLAELMASLHVLAEPEHHSESRSWAGKTAAALSGELRSELRRFSPLWARYRMRLFFPQTMTLNRSLDEEITELCNTPDDLFVPFIANAIRGRATTWKGAAEVLTSKEWLAECEHKSFNRGDLAYALVSDRERFRGELADVLNQARKAYFDDDWESVRLRLGGVANQVNAALARDDAVNVVASIAQMASRRNATQTVVFDKLQNGSTVVGSRGLLLIPSLRSWPHVMIKMDPQLPVVIQFIAQEARHDNTSPSQQQVRRRLAVLSEPGRWELCRHLIGESITTSELAERTQQSEPAVSRHLKILRDAGLVSSQRDGRQVFHRMHPAVITQLSQDALSALMR